MHATREEVEEEVLLVSSPELVLLLEQECAKLAAVVEAAVAWSRATPAGRHRTERRLRHEVEVLTQHRLLS